MLHLLGLVLPSPTSADWSVSREVPCTSLALGSCYRACRFAGPWLRLPTCTSPTTPLDLHSSRPWLCHQPHPRPERPFNPKHPSAIRIPAPASKSQHTRLRLTVLPVLDCGGMEYPPCESASCPPPCERLADLQGESFQSLDSPKLGMVNRLTLIIPLYSVPPTYF